CDATNWKEVRDMDFDTFDARFRAERAQGFQVVDFESYTTPSGQRYAAIWQQMPPDRDWEVRIDLDMKWFLNAFHRYQDQGLRLIDFESYDTPTGVRYAGVWAENDARHDYAMAPVLDTAIANYRATHVIPGISVVIMQDGEVVYRRGFGWADSAEAKQAHAGTVYMTASVAKAIGATLAAKIQLQRDANGQPLIDLSRPTSDYVKVPSSHTHTLEQLLRKHGCIWHYSDGGPQPTETYYRWQAEPVDSMQGPMISRRLANGTLLNCVPGQFYHYSTHGFTFVGAALEKVTGKDLTTLIQDEIAGPFSLTSLRVAAPKIPVAVGPGGSWIDRYEMAQGYHFNTTTNRVTEIQYEESSWKILGGGLQSSAHDLAQFGWLTLDGKIAGNPDTELWQAVTAPNTWVIPNPNPPPATISEPNQTVGLAWVIRTLNATTGSAPLPLRRIAEHGGTAPGARSQLQIYREAGCRLGSGGYGACASNPGQPRRVVVAIMTNTRFSPVANNNTHPIQALSDRLGAIVLRNPPW
ncbi:MAG: serine hydrolase, partial [Gemmatimonadales bacterium]